MGAIRLKGERETARLAAKLAALAKQGDVLALKGDLGAGKTAFARAFVRAYLDNPREEVPSPTFTLVQTYEGARGAVWHFDLYRLSCPGEAEELDIEEAFASAVSLIEWPERLGGGRLPVRTLVVDIRFGAASDERLVELTGWSERLQKDCA
jgi:tRNA threonylcarbamoyl adenosine modification protein YjeE